MSDEYLTTTEALAFLKIARSTLYKWMDEGKLRSYKFSGAKKVYFKRAELEALFRPNEPGEALAAPVAA